MFADATTAAPFMPLEPKGEPSKAIIFKKRKRERESCCEEQLLCEIRISHGSQFPISYSHSIVAHSVLMALDYSRGLVAFVDKV